MEPSRSPSLSYKIPLKIGFSPCPNDTFIFGYLAEGLFKGHFPYQFVIEDVETLNQWALSGRLPVTKLSFGVFPEIIASYELLPVGAALGFGCGPLLVAKEPVADLSQVSIAVPGLHTTAYLLLRFYAQRLGPVIPMRYDEIIPALCEGKIQAGLLIHEGRFVYQKYGLSALLDLGKWWEEKTGLPLPLGGIFIKRKLPLSVKKGVCEDIRQSLSLARQNPQAIWPFIAAHAQELSSETIQKHLETFVNTYTYELGPQGKEAVAVFLKLAQKERPELKGISNFLFEEEGT